MYLNRAQREKLHEKWKINDQGMTYMQFRRTVMPAFGMDCVLVPWCGMVLGIEATHPYPGYCHS